jgi:hypothetical protein
MPPDDLPAHDRVVAVARAALAAERFAAAWEAGRERSISEAVNEALALAGNIAQSRMLAL